MNMAVLAGAAAISPAAWMRELFRREPVLAGAALLLGFSLAPTLFAMAIDGRTFNGINLWDKVVKFQVALVVYLATLAWFAAWLPRGMMQTLRYRLFRAVVLFCIAAEMVWIGGSAAAGVGSHFNVSSQAMEGLYGLMGAFAVMLTSATLVFAVAIGRNRDSVLDPAFRLSVVLGLALTFVLTVIVAGYMASTPGHWIGGVESDANGLPVMGWARDGGDLRVAHFFATHAMHFVPAAGIAAAALLAPGAARRAVWTSAILLALLVGFTFAQALAGRPFLALAG